MFQVRARFTCDGVDCEETAECWVNVAIDEDTEHDSYGGKTTTYSIETTTSPEGWHQGTKWGTQRHYCSMDCEHKKR